MQIDHPDYDRAFSLIKDCVDRWNPYGLIPEGAENDDEFSREVHALVKGLDRIRSPSDAAHRIAQIFGSSFAPSGGFTVEACREVGAELYQNLRDARLV